MAIVILLSLLVLSFSQNCSTAPGSPYCTNCSYISTTVSCSACSTNAFNNPVRINGVNQTVNGNLVWTCQLCSTANAPCLTCQYNPTMTYGIYCTSCLAGYGIPFGVWGCIACPTGCLACNAYTTGMGSACGPNVLSTNCGTNGLVCSQCATGYALSTIDYNCYSCPVVVKNCLVNSCSQVAFEVFSCSSCSTNAFNTPVTVNGVNQTVNGNLVWTCQLCSTANAPCLTCQYNPTMTYGIYCTSCLAGYGIPFGVWGCIACPTGCLACNAYTTGMGSACGPNVLSTNCGTNGLVCSQCATGYTLNSVNLNCYLGSTVELEDNYGANKTNWLVVGLSVLLGLTSVLAIVFIILYIRNRSAKGEISLKLLSAEIEIGHVSQ